MAKEIPTLTAEEQLALQEELIGKLGPLLQRYYRKGLVIDRGDDLPVVVAGYKNEDGYVEEAMFTLMEVHGYVG